MPPTFDWNIGNIMKNEIKHNISAFEAESVFSDPKMVVFFDPKHSKTEYRYICLGESNQKRIVFVAFTFRGVDVVRVISVRLANKKEKQVYESYR